MLARRPPCPPAPPRGGRPWPPCRAKNANVDTRQDSVDPRRFLGPFWAPLRPTPAAAMGPRRDRRNRRQPRSHRASSPLTRPLATSGETVRGLRGEAFRTPKGVFSESTFHTHFSAPNRQNRVYRPGRRFAPVGGWRPGRGRPGGGRRTARRGAHRDAPSRGGPPPRRGAVPSALGEEIRGRWEPAQCRSPAAGNARGRPRFPRSAVN